MSEGSREQDKTKPGTPQARENKLGKTGPDFEPPRVEDSSELDPLIIAVREAPSRSSADARATARAAEPTSPGNLRARQMIEEHGQKPALDLAQSADFDFRGPEDSKDTVDAVDPKITELELYKDAYGEFKRNFDHLMERVAIHELKLEKRGRAQDKYRTPKAQQDAEDVIVVTARALLTQAADILAKEKFPYPLRKAVENARLTIAQEIIETYQN